MNRYAFHITLYDLAFLGMIFIAFTFILLLWFGTKKDKIANRFLAIAVVVASLSLAHALAISIQLSMYFPFWSRLPMHFSLALGPLIFFYVVALTRPDYKFRRNDLLHFSPLLLELGGYVLETIESIKKGVANYDTLVFHQLNPFLQLLTFISVIIYLYRCRTLIENFYQQRKFIGGDRYRLELRWLQNLLKAFGVLCVLWIFVVAIDYFYYDHSSNIKSYHPLYLVLMSMLIWISVKAFLSPEIGSHAAPALKPLLPAELKQKGIWLKKIVKENRYYEDPELSLSSLAEKLNLHTHELSRIINSVFKKSFSDFINEYRVNEVVRKMQDPEYNQLTLQGIAFDSGFNSKTTFQRIFKQMTGKSPSEYKTELKKESPFYNLDTRSRSRAIISPRAALPKWSPQQLNRNYMFKTYFKTSIRNLWKNKGYSFLNVFGLAIGIACAGLIFLWVENELNWDQFHTKKDVLYRILENQKYDNYVATFGSTPASMAPVMKQEIPGVANTCRVIGYQTKLITIGNKSIYAFPNYVDSSLFSMFTFPFVQGNAATAFRQLYSMVLTESTSKKFFGDEKNVIGKTVRVDNKQDYVITGVIKDIPKNSTVQFEWVAPFEIWWNENHSWAQSWGNNDLDTYVELKPSGNSAVVDKILYDFIQKREPKSNARPFLWSAHDWHLRGQFENGVHTRGGQIEYVRLFSLIAWIILLIGCINFMNLATARSEKRAREVGVRKVLGAAKQNLILQFVGESILMAVLSAIIAVIIILIALPSFNLLAQKNLTLRLTDPLHFSALTTITLVCGLIAGSYPSLYLSSFNPVFVLKGLKLKDSSASLVRKGLVILQFSVSIILIISTIVIFQQIQHVKNRSLGFNKNNLLQINTNDEFNKNLEVIQHDLLGTGVIQNLALSDYSVLYGGNNTGGLVWEGKPANSKVLISTRFVSPGFMTTYGLKLLSGRDFVATDSITSKKINVIITKSFQQLMGKGSALSKTLHWDGDTSGTVVNVVGVVNDFVYGDMYGQPDPVMFSCVQSADARALYVRLKTVEVETAIKKIEAVLKKDNPSYPFIYQFTDDQFNAMFLNEQVVSELSRVFASLAIIISCLGLFGLVAFTAERRTKEIGIRKVLGASVAGITTLLSKDFLKLVAISCVVAFPVSWWMMHSWLQNYKYRIEISWWIFLAAGMSAMLIALITISFQSIKAAIANPVKSLRSE